MSVRKPNLPKSVEWPQSTAKWFEQWRKSPATDNWDTLQWSYLIDTALIHAEVWEGGNTALLGELHKREAYMGVRFDPKPPKKTDGKPTILQMVINDRAQKHLKASNG